MDPQSHLAVVRRSFARFRLICVWLAASSATAGAPATPPATEPVEFTVTELPRAGRLISVPLHKGVVVDFSVPVSEVRMANPEIADVAVTGARQILITGKSFGVSQLLTWTEGGGQQFFDVTVELELERLAASLRASVPRAQVRAQSVLDTVVLSGTVPDADAAQRAMEIAGIYAPRVVNHLRVAGVQQVLLRCTVAEVNKRATRQLGFNGWIAGDNVQDMFVVSQVGGINPANIGAAAGANVTGRIPFATGTDGLPLRDATTLSFGFPRVQMQVFIQALRENGLVKILAEPNLVTISGQEASFLAGGEFPVPVPQGGTSNAITIEYREFGIRLRFTPAVISENLIRLHVVPEVSEPDFSAAVRLGGFVVPGLIQRKVDTVVELGPGQTFALGGLLSERVRGVSSKVPGLGDMPVLGALFSSVQYQNDETELVVLVTPELVAPLDASQVAYVPGAELASPNDAELFLEGRLEGRRAGARQSGGPADPAGPPRPTEAYGHTLSKLRGPVGPAGSAEGE